MEVESMPKVIICGRGGSGKSTLVALLARELGERAQVLVVDADESNLGLNGMLGLESPSRTVMDFLGGKKAVGAKLMARLRGEGDEELKLFESELTLENMPGAILSGNGSLSLARIGKIEHSMEGCACPMGAVARSFLKGVAVKDGQWILVDTEAGIEHFGRGVLEGADYVLLLVDPSQEAVVLAEKACGLAKEAGKACGVVLSKVDEKIKPVLEGKLAQKGITPVATISYHESIARAGLEGEPPEEESLREDVRRIIAAIESRLG